MIYIYNAQEVKQPKEEGCRGRWQSAETDQTTGECW